MKIYYQFKNILNNKEKGYLTIILVLTLLSGILELLGISMVPAFLYAFNQPNEVLSELPHFINNIYKNFFAGKLLEFFALIILIIFILKNVLLFFFNYITIMLRGNTREGIINRTNKYYNALEYKEIIKENSSDIIRNITAESQNTNSALRDMTMLFNELILIFFIITMNFIFNFKITLFTFLILIIPSFVYYFFTKDVLKKIGSENVDLRSKLILTINHQIGSFKENFIQHKINFLEKYFKVILSKEITNIKKFNVLAVLPRIFLELIAVSIIFLTILVLDVDKNNIIAHLPSLSFFFVSLVKLMPSIVKVTVFITKINFNLKSVEVIYNIHKKSKDNKIKNENLKQRNIKTDNKSFTFKNSIKFENVSFNYINKTKKLKNLNFEIKRNDTILINGHSGSGKSTLIDLILGLQKPDEGKIMIDNYEIDSILTNWQKKISLLPQKVFLIDDTIKENIIFGGVKSENDERINEIIKVTNLENLINSLDDKIDSKVGDLGRNLSGGEIQRIGLARCLYRDFDVLVCDEPTTGLDDDNSKNIMNIFSKISKEKTLIIVSHSNNTKDICNKILQLENHSLKVIKN